MRVYSVLIVGVGKIARDQHFKSIAANPRLNLAGVVSTSGANVDGVPTFATPAEAFRALPDLDVVSICTPPSVRAGIAREALLAGKHVMLEKPPTPTVAPLLELQALAARAGLTLMTTWHSQYNAAVDEAKKRLAGKALKSLDVTWVEDVDIWHPGQDWIWEAGNFGVFDPGINALSIVTKIVPEPAFVKAATLHYPANKDAPIAADLRLSSLAREGGADYTARFDWGHKGPHLRKIEIETTEGEKLRLAENGAQLFVGGRLVVETDDLEYEGIYAHFARLLDGKASFVDLAPFQLVADAFMIASRRTVAPFTAAAVTKPAG